MRSSPHRLWHATPPTEPRHSRPQPRAYKVPRKGAPATREGGVEHDGSARAARQRRAVKQQRAQPAEVGRTARIARERAQRLAQQRRAARVGQQPAQRERVDHLEHVEARVSGERHALECGDGARVVQEVGRQLEAKVGREAHLLAQQRVEAQRRQRRGRGAVSRGRDATFRNAAAPSPLLRRIHAAARPTHRPTGRRLPFLVAVP
eukprot:scaffold97912_cov24-Phaeocystis_antarctica.AAC.1